MELNWRITLETKCDRSFNCAESVLIGVNRENPIPDYSSSCMKIASVLGGGIAGTGEVCGAVSGSVICLALLLGTDGNESLEDFKSKRSQARETIKVLMNDFTHDWGSIKCNHLIAMDEGNNPQVGSLRKKDSPRKRCEDYVNWAVQRTNELRESDHE